MREFLTHLLERLLGRDPRLLGRNLILYVIVGLVAGMGAVGFYYLLDLSRLLFMDYLAHYHPATAGHEHPLFPLGPGAPLRRWLLLLVPAVGGLISGFIVFTFAPEAEGHGTDAAIAAYHSNGRPVRARVPLIKAITSAITIGSGGSAGREGPIAQIGSGFGSLISQILHLPLHERRTLMAAGMGAGIGAIFHAPLAGALFAAEVMYKELDLEHEVLVPAFIASIVAYAVFGTFFGFHPLFVTPDYTLHQASMLLPFVVLTVVCAVGAAMYVTAFYRVRGFFFGRLHVPNHIKPAIGGLIVGLIGFFLPEALGTGYGMLQLFFNGDLSTLVSSRPLAALLPSNISSTALAAILLASIGLAKIVTTAFTVGSGGSGGVFGPAVAIGGALGGATGILCQQLFPAIPVQPGAFALVGMAGFFAGAANTPISTMIMISEMTGNYNLLVPCMLVCIGSYVLCRQFTLYRSQLSSRLEAPSQLGNMAVAVLRQLPVAVAMESKGRESVATVMQSAGFAEVMERFTHSSQVCLPVVNAENRLTGVIDTRDIRRAIREPGFQVLVTANDLEAPAATVTPADSLLTAIQRTMTNRSEGLVVVDADDAARILGILSRGDIIAAYDRNLLRESSSRSLEYGSEHAP